METVGQKLKDLREHARLSQEELSRRAGVSTASISKIEQGRVQHPSRVTVLRIADALGVSPDQLLIEVKQLSPAAQTILLRLLRAKEDPENVDWSVRDILAVKKEFARIGVSNEAFTEWFEDATVEDLVYALQEVVEVEETNVIEAVKAVQG
jgi:transcriptional regulator with XRE-family HTH domain